MNRKRIFATIVIVFVSGAIIAWKQFGLFFFVRMVSGANEPTLTKGELYVASDIANAKRFDFCLFENINEPGRPVWIFRICGVPGDTVEIKEGVAYVNKVNIDRSLTLSHAYKIRMMDTVNLEIEEFEALPIGNSDSLIVNLSDHSVVENSIRAVRYILQADSIDQQMKRMYNKNWNRDHFGPVVIPEGAVFLLGDNRDDALDSRIIGLIKRENIKGCVLFRR